jgi:WD40 repeat protein
VAYLVMRLLRGGNVQTLLGQGPLALETTAHMLEQICSALHAAHRTGVIHRDLKPANVLLDDDQNAYLADFGLAKNLGNPDLENATQMDAIIGSPQYMSPEQIRSLSVRPQTDIYCLGVMLYEMLTGVLPFRGPTPFDLIQQHMNTPMPPLAANQAGLPAALDAVVGRATAKEPEERYDDALALFHDFREALGLVVAAAPLSIAYEEEETDIDVPNPFKGLRAFGEADADDFFGRETLVQQLLARLGEGGELSRFLAVIGPSGSGKSSVVRAGLIPALRRGGLPGSENWFIVDMLPGRHPFEELEAALLRVAVNPPESLLSQLKDGPRGLLRAVQRVLPADESVELVLVIDQFEEVFTLVEDEAERALLLESLATAVLDERSRLRVLITLRADFMDKPLRYVDFGELIDRRFELVLPLTADEVERAVAGPVQRAGLRLEKGLVSTIIREAGDQPGTLPLLQHAMAELFEKRERRTLTLKGYHEIGGVLGALGRTAEAIYDGLDEAGKAAARQLFLRLVTLGEGTEDTRRRVLAAEIEALFGKEQASVGKVLDAYGKARLLTFDRDPLTRGATVEVAHEALLREWGRLGEWLDESRADVRLQRQLAAASAEWQAGGNDPSFLFTGSRLGQFAGWAASTTLALTPDERAFLEAGIAERDRLEQEEQVRAQRELESAQKLAEEQSRRAEEQAQAAGRLRRRAYLLAGALVLAVLLAGAAVFLGDRASRSAAAEHQSALTAQRNEDEAQLNAAAAQNAQATAQAERDRADEGAQTAFSRELAVQSRLNLDQDTERSVLLALQGYETSHTKEALDALRLAVNSSRVMLTVQASPGQVWDVAFSPDGTHIASAGVGDNMVKVWEAATGKEALSLIGHTDALIALDYSPDGARLASGSFDGTVRLWDTATGAERLKISTGRLVSALQFGPDGSWLVTTSWDESQVRFWDTHTGQELFTLSSPDWLGDDPPWRTQGIALSPDGTRLALSLDRDGAGRYEIWDLTARQREFILQAGGDASGHRMMDFSPDGTKLAISRAGDATNTASVWDVATGMRLFGLARSANQIGFTADGRRLYTATSGGRADVWDAATGALLLTLGGHGRVVTAAAANSDCMQAEPMDLCGTRLVTSGADGKIKVWDITPGGRGEGLVLPGRDFAVADDWSQVTTYKDGPDGETILSSWEVPSWSLDELEQGSGPAAFTWEKPPDSASFRAIGDYWLNISEDGTLTLFDTRAPGAEPLTCCRHEEFASDPGTAVAISADGKVLAHDWAGLGLISLVDLASKQVLTRPTISTQQVITLSLSAHGERLAALTAPDGDIKVWDIPSGQLLATLPADINGGSPVVLSPDGNLVAKGNCDGTVMVGDVTTGREKFRLRGHGACVNPVVFSQDGTMLASGSPDRTVRIWDLADGSELVTLPGSDGSVSRVAFSPDRKLVLAGGAYEGGRDLDTRAFLLDPVDLVALAESRLTRALTPEECQAYLHGECPASLSGPPAGEPSGNQGEPRRLAEAAYNVFRSDARRNLFGLLTLRSLQAGYNPLADLALSELVGHDALPREFFSPNRDILWSVDVSSDGKYMVTAGADATARLWDLASGEIMREYAGHTAEINTVRFSPDDQTIVTAASDNTALVWEVASGEIVQTLSGCPIVSSGGFSPDGRQIITDCGADFTFRIWDVATGTPVHTLTGHTDWSGGEFTPDGRHVLTQSWDDTFRLYDAATGEEVKVFPGGASTCALAISPNSQYAATCDFTGGARLWDIASGELVREFPGDQIEVSAVAFSPDGQYLFTGGSEGASTIRVWDVATGEPVHVFRGPLDGVKDISISPDRQLMAVVGIDGIARVWDLQAPPIGSQFAASPPAAEQLSASGGGLSLAVGPDGMTSVSAAGTGEMLVTLASGSGLIREAILSPDGKSLLTTGDDGTVRLWDVATGEELRRISSHADDFTDLAFSEDGRYILASGADGLERAWPTSLDEAINAVCAALTRDFTPEEREEYEIPDDGPTCPQE